MLCFTIFLCKQFYKSITQFCRNWYEREIAHNFRNGRTYTSKNKLCRLNHGRNKYRVQKSMFKRKQK